MFTIKTSLITILLVAAFSLTAYAQNYLDKDNLSLLLLSIILNNAQSRNLVGVSNERIN